MGNTIGVYVMQIASTMTGMHPQTLRKYERAGFLEPSRHYNSRMYSNDDIARLKMIKRLVDDEGLNIAGLGLALKLRDKLVDMKEEIISSRMECRTKDHFTNLLDEMLEVDLLARERPKVNQTTTRSKVNSERYR